MITFRPTSHPADLDLCVDIWLEASLAAHSFIPAQFWFDHKNAMRDEYLPASDVFLALEDGNPVGFAALTGSRLAAMFVKPARQNSGVGKALMNYILHMRQSPITLSVYQRNERALEFYRRLGFETIALCRCVFTGEMELEMKHKKTLAKKDEGKKWSG